jgi:TonB family protein
MEKMTDERMMMSGLFKELRGMLFISTFSHVLIISMLGLAIYHYSWARQDKDSLKYPVYSVNLVDFLEPPIMSRPQPLPALLGPIVEGKKYGLPSFLKPNFRPANLRRASSMAIVTEEPINPPAINKKVAYPTRLKRAKTGKPKKNILSHILYKTNLKKIISRQPMTNLRLGREQPIRPTLIPSTNLISRPKIKPLGKPILSLNKSRLDIPDSFRVGSYPIRSVKKGKTQQLAGLFVAEAQSPTQIIHPAIPPAPNPSPFAQQREGVNPSLIKGGFTSLNSKDPNLIPYIGQIKERVLGFWRYPLEAKSGLSGTVQLAFTVERDGSVSRIELLKSSGSPPLDNGAMQALSRASPFDPLPQEIKVANLYIAGTFKYNVE